MSTENDRVTAGDTRADDELTKLGWEDLIAREFIVILPDGLRQVLGRVCRDGDLSPGGAVAMAVRQGLNQLLADEDYQYYEADPCVIESFQDWKGGAYPPQWAEHLWEFLGEYAPTQCRPAVTDPDGQGD